MNCFRVLCIGLSFMVCLPCLSLVPAEPSLLLNEETASLLGNSSPKRVRLENAPQSMTRNIRKRRNGELLFASVEDLIQYNGKSFQTLKIPSGIKPFEAFDLLEDAAGTIWIASRRYGLYRFRHDQLMNFTVKDGLAHNRTISLHEDRTGRIWVATMGGLNYFDGNKLHSFKMENGLSSNDIRTVFVDSKNRLWVGTSRHLNIANLTKISANQPTGIRFSKTKDSNGVPFVNVWSILEDRQGNIWLSDIRGIWRFSKNSFVQISNETRLARLYEDNKGNIWFSHGNSTAKQEGLSYFESQSLASGNPKATQVYLTNSMIFSISQDSTNTIWIGTIDGVFRYDGKIVEIVSHDGPAAVRGLRH